MIMKVTYLSLFAYWEANRQFSFKKLFYEIFIKHLFYIKYYPMCWDKRDEQDIALVLKEIPL